jgi:hypothetical protein
MDSKRHLWKRYNFWVGFCTTFISIRASMSYIYRISQNDVPDFNKFLHKFDTTQVNIISTDEKENSLSFLETSFQITGFQFPTLDLGFKTAPPCTFNR